jgi:hypothetical protein
MSRSILVAVCIASLASFATGCAASHKPAVAAPVQEQAPRVYNADEYTAPEEKEIYVSEPQETQARKDTSSELQPTMVTQRKAKQLLPQGH